MHFAVHDAELAANQLPHALERPQIGAEAGRLRAGQQHRAQRLVLQRVHLGRTAPFAHHAQGLDATSLQHAAPAVHRLARCIDPLGHLRRRHPRLQQSARTHPSSRRLVHRPRASLHTQ